VRQKRSAANDWANISLVQASEEFLLRSPKRKRPRASSIQWLEPATYWQRAWKLALLRHLLRASKSIALPAMLALTDCRKPIAASRLYSGQRF
jgi:hypothetical protein